MRLPEPRSILFGLAAAAVACASAAATPEPDPSPAAGEPAAAGVSLTQSMQADSGVAIQTLCTNCNNADLSVSGLGNEHVAVICDGMSVPAGLGQIYLLSVMPSTVIDKVAVTRGAGGPELEARAVGGAIEIERREPSDLVINASADTGQYGWSGVRVDISGTSDRVGRSFVGSWGTQDTIDLASGAQARAAREALAASPAAAAAPYPALPSFDRYTLDGRGDVKMGDAHVLYFGAMVYRESQENGPAGVGMVQDPSTSDPPAFSGYNLENVELKREQYDFRYEFDLDNGAKLEASGAWVERSQDIDETDLNDPAIGSSFVPAYFIDELQRQLALTFSQPVGQRTMVRGGVDATHLTDEIVDVRFQLGFPGFVFEEDVKDRSLWVEGDVALGSAVELSVGARYVDYGYEDNEFRAQWLPVEEGGTCTDPTECARPEGDRLLPRAALRWKPVDELQLRFSAGTGYRVPPAVYDEVCCGRKYRNNRGMRIEESASYGIEATYQPAPGFRFGAAAFVTDFDHLILKMATLTDQFFKHTYQNVNVPEARRQSLSLDFSAKATAKVTVKASYSWLDAENRTDGDAIPFVRDPGFVDHATFFSERIPYSVEQRGTLGLDFAPGGGWRFGASTQHTGETLIQRFDGNVSNTPSFTEAESFWVTNLNFSKQFAKGVSLFAGVDNISDYTQSDLGNPNFDANWGPLRGRYAYAGLGYSYGAKAP